MKDDWKPYLRVRVDLTKTRKGGPTATRNLRRSLHGSQSSSVRPKAMSTTATRNVRFAQTPVIHGRLGELVELTLSGSSNERPVRAEGPRKRP
jgi:hypothetical protein